MTGAYVALPSLATVLPLLTVFLIATSAKFEAGDRKEISPVLWYFLVFKTLLSASDLRIESASAVAAKNTGVV